LRAKVVVTDYIEPDLNWESEEFARRGVEFEYHQLKFAPDEEVIRATRDADVVVVNMVKITANIVAAWNRTKVVIRHGVGYDNLDLDALERAGIAPCYIPDYCAEEVAEQAIALILACGRRVVSSRKVLDDSAAHGAWDFAPMIPIFRMGGQTLGILGCGRIGSLVYLKLKSFGFKFLICDPYLTEERKRELGIETVDKETMFAGSDFVTIHTPLSSETRHIVNARTLAMMKSTAYLVNTARGPMVDSGALADALKRGVIAGAAIDVFDREPPPLNYPLFGLDNAILTPHLAWYSEDAAWTIRKLIVLEVDRYLAGQPPRYIAKKMN
jgi:D-3-phosphoglycerate dehydrogenase